MDHIENLMDSGLIPDTNGLSVDSMRGSEQYIRHRDVDATGQLDNGNDRTRDALSYHERRALINAGILKPDERDIAALQTAKDPYGTDQGTAPLERFTSDSDETPPTSRPNTTDNSTRPNVATGTYVPTGPTAPYSGTTPEPTPPNNPPGV